MAKSGVQLPGTLLPITLAIFALSTSVLATSASRAEESERLLNATITVQAQTDTGSQRTQQAVDQLTEQGREYFAEYRVAAQRLDQLRIYNANLEQLVADQQREAASLRGQLENFGDIEEGIVPLMYELVASLRTFIELDMPFLQNERYDRVQRLEANLERSDLTVSEKYRQIMEAYQIETGYGRNIETYPGKLEVGGTERKVDLLRIGRVVLAFQTPDQTETGYWDKLTQSWVSADDSFRRAVTQGIRMAKKQAAPTLLELPLPAAEAAQ